ncbi:MAG: hypothetical protein ACHQNV_08210 [Vicinamibacteria bacterium]
MKSRNLSSGWRARLLLLGLAVSVPACSASNLTGTTTPTTDTFTGTLLPSGSITYDVTVKGNGELDLSITSLTPQTTITVGLAIGVSASGGCSPLTNAENAKVGSILPAEVTPGQYCVAVYDVGNVLNPGDTFTISVLHP